MIKHRGTVILDWWIVAIKVQFCGYLVSEVDKFWPEIIIVVEIINLQPLSAMLKGLWGHSDARNLGQSTMEISRDSLCLAYSCLWFCLVVGIWCLCLFISVFYLFCLFLCSFWISIFIYLLVVFLSFLLFCLSPVLSSCFLPPSFLFLFYNLFSLPFPLILKQTSIWLSWLHWTRPKVFTSYISCMSTSVG